MESSAEKSPRGILYSVTERALHIATFDEIMTDNKRILLGESISDYRLVNWSRVPEIAEFKAMAIYHLHPDCFDNPPMTKMDEPFFDRFLLQKVLDGFF